MEAKAVTTGMTAMSRRSREHRASKNAGTIQEAPIVLQLDIASPSKTREIGVSGLLDGLEQGRDHGESGNLRRSSRSSRLAQGASAAYGLKGLEGCVNGAKVHVRGVKNVSVSPALGKSPAVVGGEGGEVRPQSGAGVEAGEGASSAGREAPVANSNGTSALTGSGGMLDAGGQANGRPLRGRPRGRHVMPAKKIAKRAKRLQEVSLTESDGARILGRRIKVFWRDEDRWFYGVVKAYNRGRRTHKIVYDDKEEEWVKLHEEKFKLQVLKGEVFGASEEAVAGLPADVTGSESKVGRLTRKENGVRTQEHLDGKLFAISANGGAREPVVTSNVHVPSTPVRVSEHGLESPGVCIDGKFGEQSSSIRKEGFNEMGGLQESEDASPMVCESVDLEDPYAIDHTSISDSLVMFMRSKQSLADSRKAGATSGVVASSESAAPGAKSIIEVSLCVEAPLCSEAKDSEEIYDFVLASSEASDVVSDPVSSKGCTFEAREVAGRVPCEDGEGPVMGESLENAEGGSIDSSNESGMQSVAEVLEGCAIGGLHTSGQCNRDYGVGADLDFSCADLSGVDLLVCVRKDAGRVGPESKEGDTLIAGDAVGEFRKRVVESSVGGEVGVLSEDLQFVGSASVQGRASETEPVARSSIEESLYDMRQLQSPWLLSAGRFFSWSIGRNLVNVDCTIPRQDLGLWILRVDNVWRCVPYLTLFVDVILEGDRSGKEMLPGSMIRCYWEESAKGISLRRSVLSAVFSRIRRTPGLTCPYSTLGSARVVLHGTRTSLDGSNAMMLVQQGNDIEVAERSVEASPSCSAFPSASSDRRSAELSCKLKVVEQPCEPILNEEPGYVRPVLEVTDSEDCRFTHVGDVVLVAASSRSMGQTDASESYAAAPNPYSSEDGIIRESKVAVSAESGGGLTEVQIGSAVEGEDDGGLACYRSWKSVKRGFSQIVPEDLGSSGLGTGNMLQGLLDSELGCMALTKRQKVHVESLSSMEYENGNEGGEKQLSLKEIEMHRGMTTRSVHTIDCDSAVPRVNVLKLRKCSTGKGGWRVAGNSCTADRSKMQSGDGGESLTPSSTSDRKRLFTECFELNQPESLEENGHPASFKEVPHENGHEVSNAHGPDDVKVKVTGMWSNCEVSSIHDVSYNRRKRFKHGSTSSGSSDDSYAPQYRADAAYPSRNSNGHVFPVSACQGCMANVLVVQHDRGWREHGATIELRSCQDQGWMLVIAVRGENMYAYKAEHAMVTGSTNRHSHAIVWKGGKGWSLEFEDKKQWQAFKELHEECYRLNSKISSVRQIPIPGVRHMEELAPKSPVGYFVRPHSTYISRTEDEVEMALGKSRVVYDMDSEDEQWLGQINTERSSARGTRTRPLIAEETLERLMDKLEKNAYLCQQQLKSTELNLKDVTAESCTGLATQEVIKVIYGYWVEKRTRKGMALVRHFQPPAWEQYQKQLKLWEQEIAALQLQQPSATMQQLMNEVRKPPLFAFCLRPRRLEAQHKLLKQKSHRKQPWPGSAPRAWVGLGSSDGSLDRRQYHTEPGNGLPHGPRRPGRPRLTEITGANLTGTFNTMGRTLPVSAGATLSMDYLNSSGNDDTQQRVGKGKKVGRKAHRQRLLAASQESRRKRLLLRDVGSIELQQEPDLTLAAARARSTAEAARARAQALYAVADAAMHKAVAAVLAADALHAAELLENTQEEAAAAGGESGIGPTFGSWRRGVPGSALGESGMKGSGSRHGPESDGEDALLPVASWSEELGAGLGTRLLNKDAEVGSLMGTRSVLAGAPGRDAGLMRTRGEGMVAVLSR